MNRVTSRQQLWGVAALLCSMLACGCAGARQEAGASGAGRLAPFRGERVVEIARRPDPAPAAAPTVGGPLPDWVEKGSGAYALPEGRFFLGVGTASGIRNHALARSTAQNRARAEVAKLFETFSAGVMRGYMGGPRLAPLPLPPTPPDGEPAPAGVFIIDSHTAADGTAYALAVLDVEGIIKNVARDEYINPRVKEYFRTYAAAAHQQMCAP